jgi:hypothetical protein
MEGSCLQLPLQFGQFQGSSRAKAQDSDALHEAADTCVCVDGLAGWPRCRAFFRPIRGPLRTTGLGD